jgi:hypothetical protein
VQFGASGRLPAVAAAQATDAAQPEEFVEYMEFTKKTTESMADCDTRFDNVILLHQLMDEYMARPLGSAFCLTWLTRVCLCVCV